MKSKPLSIALLAISCVAVLSLWFAASVVTPALIADYGIGPTRAAMLTTAVQIGFVAGSLVSAILGLPDRLDPRLLYCAAALTGAVANAAFLFVEPGSTVSIVLRLITGAIMAGVYPVAMKLSVSWAKNDAGLLVGTLVGALTVGSALPHLFAFAGDLDWRVVMTTASTAAAIGAVLVLGVGIGPGFKNAGRFDPHVALRALKSRPLRLANFGYFGHMWELYAVWAWLGSYIAASFTVTGMADAASNARLVAFLAIGSGALGAFGGGYLADRIGRTRLTIIALAISGVCCLAAGPLFGAAPGLIVLLSLVWGVSVIADSAQFSTGVAELSEPGTQGTILTVQTAIGFAITVITVQGLPAWVELVGWQWAFLPLVLGPIFGIVAMARLRNLPEAAKMAGGKR
ncbi:MFS transporter [Rhizobiales bacterium]|uniref:MFS transporter n=1 Tax=Hongsoonwoonella zoysiae TaxID=2821844 RepID=UPI0015603DB1|nr:MFS transporter [Hongsoonwoonella zoysiae]NRG18754.1 MFS transporter [Hongsoonwoonella zoysiae]